MSTVIIITPPTKPPKATESEGGSGYELHTIGGELTDRQKREILRELLKDLRDE